MAPVALWSMANTILLSLVLLLGPRKCIGKPAPTPLTVSLGAMFNMDTPGLATFILATHFALRGNTRLLVAGIRARALNIVEVSLLRQKFTVCPLVAVLVRKLITTTLALSPSPLNIWLTYTKGPLSGLTNIAL